MSAQQKFYLYKRQNGIYYIGYIHNGKRRWKTTECRQKTDALHALTKLKENSRPKETVIRLSLFLDDFLPYCSHNFSVTTFDFYRHTFKRFLNLHGDLPLTDLTMRHADIYRTVRRNDVSAHTVNRELQALKAAMNTAVWWQILRHNPFAGLQQIKIPDISPAFYTKQDFQKLLSLIKENWLKEVIIFAALTGMRRGEILNLRWQDVDLQKRVIQIQSNPTFRTKHGKRRALPINDALSDLLNVKANTPVCEHVFHIRGRKIADDRVSKKFKKYVGQAGLDPRLHFHSLRHTFASWLVQDGVSIYEVQKLLGHSSIAVTQVYSHLQPESLHATVNRLRVIEN